MNQQEEQWAGAFGEEYSKRSPGDVESNEVMFARILASMDHDPQSIIEFGAGVGNNLRALKNLLPEARLAAVEINAEAAKAIGGEIEITVGSMLDWICDKPDFDFAFTKGVLIHIPPTYLPRAYEALYSASYKHILIAEYYNPNPVMIPYRGQNDMLWKRDFAGEMMDTYPKLKLVDYGFVYKRDAYPQDDVTWFLMEKRQ